MTKKIIYINDLGDITVRKNRRSKRISIRVRPFKGVSVTIPWYVTYKRAESIIHEKSAWIKQQLLKAAEIEKISESALKPEINRNEAKTILTERLTLLAQKYGFHYNRVFIRNQTTRWGSCSAKNNINLNIKLLIVGQELMDYVILHELVHTQIKNHSQAFWQVLNHYVPNARQKQRRLNKEFGHLMYSKDL